MVWTGPARVEVTEFKRFGDVTCSDSDLPVLMLRNSDADALAAAGFADVAGNISHS